MKEVKLIAFGDIHGCYLATKAAVELAKKEDAIAVFLGDYVDRGPDSIKTLEVLIEAKKKNHEWIFLRGNHDQMLLDLIEGVTAPNTEFKVPNGLSSNEETTKEFLRWQSCSPILKNEIVSFLKSTTFYYETEHWIFVHAPLKDSNVPLDKKTKDELLWNYKTNPLWNGKQFIHGHVPVNAPKTIKKGTNINTISGDGGFLTGILINISYPNPKSNPTMWKQEMFIFSISKEGVTTNYNQP
jgi:serine/threonine protein phosphatase 1